jgi:hypothetical protein
LVPFSTIGSPKIIVSAEIFVFAKIFVYLDNFFFVDEVMQVPLAKRRRIKVTNQLQKEKGT